MGFIFPPESLEANFPASIVAIADPDKEVAIQGGEQFGIPQQQIYASFEERKLGDQEIIFQSTNYLIINHLIWR